MDETTRRFTDVPWHDSKLIGISLARIGLEDQIRLALELRGEGTDLARVDLLFDGATYLRLTIDVEGKRVCSDDISGAVCSRESPWLTELREANPHDLFEGFLHFSIVLIPPGGVVEILAKDFTLVTMSDGH